MSNRRESDYRVETCGEDPEGREAAGRGVQMSETWERLLNRDFKTRRIMLPHFLHKRPVMSAFHHRHAGEICMLRNGVCVRAHTNVRLSSLFAEPYVNGRQGKGWDERWRVCVYVGEVDVIETRLESLC